MTSLGLLIPLALAGAALFISHATARNHVSNILSKLDVESRTAAATFALRHCLV